MTLLKIDDQNSLSPGASTVFDAPVLRMGFRPFYLLAAAFAAVSVPLWMARYAGWIAHPAKVDLYWHMHEMIFGFVIAVIIGFLYTAGRNWTGLPTPTKGHLAALACLWIAGRIAMLAGGHLSAGLVDLAFLPLAAWPLYRVLKQSGNKRNMFLIVLLGLLTAANATYHAAMLEWLSVSPIKPIHAALMIIVLLESVIAGRIIPMFTKNALENAAPIVNHKRDRITVAVTALACLTWVAGLSAPITASLAIAAACTQLFRLAGWLPHLTFGNPLLWILHISYGWIPFGFVLIALSTINLVSTSAAIHVLAIGATAGLIIGMITRTTLGHTGRRLKSGKGEMAMYLLLQAGVLCRFAGAVQTGTSRDLALFATTVAWSAAFIIYLSVYGPYLIGPRLDGKEG